MRTIQLKTRGVLILSILICSENCLAYLENLYSNLHPHNSKLDFSELAHKYGHPAKKYEVTTEDGYILTLFRLPGKSRTPILLTHGLQDSSETFILRGEGSLAITLANRGYDVWICNFRGNRYSRQHQYLNSDRDDSYWNFSFHELGYYDLPVFIDKVLNETKVENLIGVGHSLGNVVYFVLGSTRPEYNSKVNVMIALAPICFLQNTKFPISIAINNAPLLNKLASKIGLTEILGDSSTLRQILFKICPLPVLGYAICAFGILFPFTGYDPTELEPNFFQESNMYFPAGGSWKTFSHFLQVGHRKQFAPYDYGSDMNHKVYNSSEPPVYDLSKVTLRVALLAGRNDNLSTLKDVDILKKHLKNIVADVVIPRLLLNHADLVWGRHMDEYLFPEIFKVLNQYV